MKPTHIRSFEIDRVRFHITDRGAGSVQVTSVHPYDETEYHWAIQASKSIWNIYRAGTRRAVFGSVNGSEITPEAIAQLLLKMDAEAHFKPSRAIW